MALHIQMSEEAEKEYKRAKLRGMLSSFGAAAALSLTFALTLTFTVIYFATDPPAEFLAYVPPAEDAPPRNQPTTPKLSSKAATPSNTVAPTMIVAAGAAPVAMAQIEVPLDDSADDGLSIDIGIGMDTGLGDDLGSDGGGMGSSQKSGSALEGTFYDFKKTKRGSATDINTQNVAPVYKVIDAFLKGWNRTSMERYYKSKTKIYASNWCLPRCKDAYAMEAFQCKECKPGAWIAVYRGKVRAPKSGEFRFLGTGDDGIAVRFGGRNVLTAGAMMPNLGAKGKNKKPNGETLKVEGLKTWNHFFGGVTMGAKITVEEGKVYPIEIMVCEVPGGQFGFVLFIQEYLEDVRKWGSLDIFRTNFSVPTKDGVEKLLRDAKCRLDGDFEWPKFNADAPIWVAVP